MINRKIKSAPLAALIIAGIAYVFNFITSRIMIGLQELFIYEVGIPVMMYSLIIIPFSLMFMIVGFLGASIIYLALVEKMKFKIGATIGISIGVAVVRWLISSMMGTVYGMLMNMMGYNEVLPMIYNGISFVITVGILFGGAMLIVSVHKNVASNVSTQPVLQMAQPVQPQMTQPVQPTQVEEPAFCKNCGQKVIPGNRFCIACGKNLYE